MDVQKLLSTKVNRRRLLTNLGMMGAGAALTACGPQLLAQPPEMDPVEVDLAILNFALNLEYLEAEYYLRGVFGEGLEERGVDVGGAAAGPVTGGRQLNFRSQRNLQNATEIALDEEAHVKFLQGVIRSIDESALAPRPAINFTDAFNTVGAAAGLSAFDPFSSDINFILGAFVFEDVGVTAYNGAAPLINNKAYLGAAASILAVEAYHAGDVRNVLFNLDGQVGDFARSVADAISDARDGLAGPDDDDQPPVGENPFGTIANVTPTNANALVFARTPRQVLNIVYLSAGASSGGFFPNGVAGDFSALGL